MATAQECLTALIEMDSALANEYAEANPARRTAINRCRSAIESTLHEMIRQDLQSRTGEIAPLTASLKGAAQTLRELASALKKVTELFKLATALVNTAQRVTAII
jgi:ABC-type transporter Mla subunit MlaD